MRLPGSIPAPGSIQPPPFKFQDVIDVAMEASAQRNLSPVRYLALGGDKPRQRTGMRWSPSAIGGCVRRNVYKALKCPEDPGRRIDRKQQQVFDRGTVMGAWMAAYARAADGHDGISNVYCQSIDSDERLVRDASLSFGGLIDIELSRWGRTYLAEVKSKDNDVAAEKISKPDREQLMQFNAYMPLRGVFSGWMVYAFPSGIIEFPHVFDPDLWEESKKQIRLLEMMARSPDRLGPKSQKPWFECGACPYRRNLCEANLSPAQALVQVT